MVIDGEEQLVSAGDVIDLPKGCKHTDFASESDVASESGLQIIEVQIGKDIRVEDKRKYGS